MKKKLVVLLAVVMMFAFSASAYAATFSDISDQPNTVKDAVAKTVALGIIEGYTDGTFGPDNNITRAEFAKIAVTAAGSKDIATMLENNASSFKDVKSGVWYTGWVNAAESKGIFLGDGNGNFRPNDTITNQEVITVLLRLLGYNDNLTGTWPVNYVNQANKIEILDDVSIVASAAAKRSDVVVMLSATLDANLVTYDKDTNEFVNKQTTKGGDDKEEISLLADSFKGSYLTFSNNTKDTGYVGQFMTSPDQVRDAADKTLNWTIGSTNYIVDGDTAVSSNATGIFDLDHQQGKVYYVKDGSKLYARYIEVKTYTKTATDKPSVDSTKIKVGSTSYNATTSTSGGTTSVTTTFGTYADPAKTQSKNSNYILYFNDDDQVYYVESDRDRVSGTEGVSYYVKSIASGSVRLFGGANGAASTVTKNLKDSDSLIYTDNGFIAPSELKVGDAIQEVANKLYVKVSDATGTLTRVTPGANSTDQSKTIIGGKTYVYAQSSVNSPEFYDSDYESVDSEVSDVVGNEVTVLLNKDNSVSVIVVGDTSVSTKLYGIFVAADGNSNIGNSSNSVSFFTSEGKTVSYTINKDKKSDVTSALQLGTTTNNALYGHPFKYTLNKSGEITSVEEFANDLSAVSGTPAVATEIEVKDNNYLVGNGKTVTLASDVVIFEVDADSKTGEVDVTIVTRASLLNGGDFTPSTLDFAGTQNYGKDNTAYAKYVESTTSNGLIKALAYTTANTNNYDYAIVDAYGYRNGDDVNKGLTFVGDDNEYELDATPDTAAVKSAAGAFVAYTKSGDTVTIAISIAKENGLATLSDEVSGVNNGQISFTNGITVKANKKNATDLTKTNVITDSNTLVYVIDSETGKYTESTMDAVSKNAHVYVPVIDSDGYADVILVDEYHDYTK